MNMLRRTALAFSLAALLSAPFAVLAEEPAKLESTPATEAAPAPMDDMQAVMQSQGMGPGNRCNKRGGPGPGMMQGSGMGMGMGKGMGPMAMGKDCDRRDGMGMGPGGMGSKCHRMGDGDGCGCDYGRALHERVEELEKRVDMLQMMLKMLMKP